MKYLLSLLCFVGSAHAGFLTGNKLLENLNGDREAYIFAQGYIASIADSNNDKDFCIPINVTVKQVVDATRAYLEKQIAYRHINASALVQVGFVYTWPCKK